MESQRVRHDRATFTFTFKIGLPWWLSGKEFVCNGRRHRRRGFDPGVGKIHWRRDRLPTPVFLSFCGGLAGKESTYNARDLGSVPGWGAMVKATATPSSILPGEFHGLYSARGRKEPDTTEQLSVSSFINYFAHIRMTFY